jgi:hypothetical protein
MVISTTHTPFNGPAVILALLLKIEFGNLYEEANQQG